MQRNRSTYSHVLVNKKGGKSEFENLRFFHEVQLMESFQRLDN